MISGMLPLFKVKMSDRAAPAVAKVLSSGFIGEGANVEYFERAFRDYAPVPLVSTGSCTAAIHAVLMLLKVGPGDEVITSPLTCIASNAPILAVGARPVWADVDPTTGNIDCHDVGLKITSRTKAIIAVNWSGRIVDYTKLKSYGYPVIEDSAHGPLVYDRPRGDFTCFSFGPIKHLTAGDGGGILTDDLANQNALRLIRWYGLDRTSSKDFRCAQDIKYPGMKFHMNNINAAIALANLPDLKQVVKQHQQNARDLHTGLTSVGVNGKLPLFVEDYDPLSNYWIFPMRVERGLRDKFKEYLTLHGIASSQVHARNDKHSAYNFPNGELRGLDHFDACQINIPCGWWITRSEVEYMVSVISEFKG